jgi:hypothetical protein
MSNPTTPFSWQMPTATDLVTDLPADFEVFGQAVATSMADLLGGTTGQILSKTTNADMDFTWTTATSGDITGVTAGTGISGGGTSGSVTVTNSMATEITAKADLIVGTGNAAFDNLPVGANGTVLTADSTVSPTGLKWASAPSPSYTWTAYTPTFTNLTTGNGTIDFRYAQVGKVVFVDGSFTLGSTSSISGYVEMTLPVTANRIKQAASLGVVTLRDAGTAWYLGYVIDANSATAVEVISINTSATTATLGSLSSSSPFTWTTSDFFTVNFTYEAV